MIDNDRSQPSLFNIDHFLQQEPLPSTNIFTLPPTPRILSPSPSSSSSKSSTQRDERSILSVENKMTTPQMSSSSSFLQETKQLLEMISSNQNFDLSRLNSEV